MEKIQTQKIEDINISYNNDIKQYVIDVKYRHIDNDGNIDIINITDIPIHISDYPNITFRHNSYVMGFADTSIDLGFGDLDFMPGVTKHETCRIHTSTKEMTLEEIEKKLGHKVKIVNKKED